MANLTLQRSDSRWTGAFFAFGDFINAVVSFLLVAAAVYFFVVVPVDALTAEGSKLVHKLLATRDMEDAISGLDNSEKEVLRHLLRKVSQAVELLETTKQSSRIAVVEQPMVKGHSGIKGVRKRRKGQRSKQGSDRLLHQHQPRLV